ncbi:MAG: 6,7-dimethyl-8-ribityllumazine synthase [Desulfovibrio sp.]|jgi:6,7-dimethyl-8-ribityllumazine synthase|nr:6,7-dimethyl-8-ribityllumazine synthase [Desulfovibrio sp.]
MKNSLLTIEGQLSAAGLKVAVAASRFNSIIVDRLVDGAVDYLTRHGLERENITLVRLPGAFELPVVCQKLARSGKFDGIVALGAVIRGATPHFDFVASEAVKGLALVSLDTGVPIGFGLLTTDDVEQAVERAGAKSGNKGADAASAMLETIRVLEQL